MRKETVRDQDRDAEGDRARSGVRRKRTVRTDVYLLLRFRGKGPLGEGPELVQHLESIVLQKHIHLQRKVTAQIQTLPDLLFADFDVPHDSVHLAGRIIAIRLADDDFTSVLQGASPDFLGRLRLLRQALEIGIEDIEDEKPPGEKMPQNIGENALRIDRGIHALQRMKGDDYRCEFFIKAEFAHVALDESDREGL